MTRYRATENPNARARARLARIRRGCGLESTSEPPPARLAPVPAPSAEALRAIGSRLPWQAEDPLADDVLLDLRRAGVDGPRARAEEVVHPRTVDILRRLGAERQVRRQVFELAGRPQDRLDQLLVALVHLAVEELVDGRLRARTLALLRA